MIPIIATMVDAAERNTIAMTQDLDPRLQLLIDKQEIFELSVNYMRGQDRLDVELQKSVYWPDATDARGFINGNGHDFCEFACNLLKDHLVNHHILGQALIEVEGDTAFGEIYFQAYHRVIEHGIERDFWMIGRYVDRYERRDGVWKIAHRSELNDSCYVHAATDDWLRSTPDALRGSHNMDDFSYQRDKLRKA
jgi:hypothetical protein